MCRRLPVVLSRQQCCHATPCNHRNVASGTGCPVRLAHALCSVARPHLVVPGNPADNLLAAAAFHPTSSCGLCCLLTYMPWAIRFRGCLVSSSPPMFNTGSGQWPATASLAAAAGTVVTNPLGFPIPQPGFELSQVTEWFPKQSLLSIAFLCLSLRDSRSVILPRLQREGSKGSKACDT